ncbi:erythritol transport system permease protein [Microbacterium murale]|uniref:Erythritol transport system permease protein n=1 Tax=Microbacterium murale TaxID=1081040 RepID=A0ABU0PAB4_9MICO|nr:erythritol transport system permease protein [Microbacterium murale]
MTTTTTAIIENKKKFSIARVLIEGRAFLALILIIVVFSLMSPNYLTFDNILIMSSHVAIYAILGLGMLLVVLNGGIDLSVGSTLGFSAVIAGFLMQGVPINIFGVVLYPSIPVVVVISCAVGAGVGLVNGILVSRFKVAPFVATLGMLYVVRGLALLMTNGLTINDLSGDEALGNTGFEWLGFNRVLNIPIGVIIMILIAIVLGFVLGRTRFGRWLYASGGNERAAELSGVPVRSVKIWVYVISGVCAAVAGLILASTPHQRQPHRRKHVRADGDRRGRDRWSISDGRARKRARHAAGGVRHRLPVRRARHRGRLRVLADGLHRCGDRRRRAAEQPAVRTASPSCRIGGTAGEVR